MAAAPQIAPAVLVLLCALSADAAAQHIRPRRYDVGDGLAASVVSSIYQDRRGYLWFATFEGLNRYDGYSFVTFGPGQGLTYPVINDIVEDPHGVLWVATNGRGIARMLRTAGGGAAGPRFETVSLGAGSAADRVNTLRFDAAGTLWCATDAGVFVSRDPAGPEPTFTLVLPYAGGSRRMRSIVDRSGRIWFGVGNDVVQVDRGVARVANAGSGTTTAIAGFAEDRDGRVIIAHAAGLMELAGREAVAAAPAARPALPLAAGETITAVAASSRGGIWVGTTDRLIRYASGIVDEYSLARGLTSGRIVALTEDADQNLWVGTDTSGVYRLGPEIIASYTTADGLPADEIADVIVASDRTVYALTGTGAMAAVTDRGVARLPLKVDTSSVTPTASVVAARHGGWWMASRGGIRHVSRREPADAGGVLYGAADGLPVGVGPFRLYEATDGTLWAGGPRGPRPGTSAIYRLPAEARPRRSVERIGLPDRRAALRLVVDPAGALWIGDNGWLARWVDGRLHEIQAGPGLPEPSPRALFVDRRGWLWIGTRTRGVSMTREPAAASPAFVNYSTAEGLSSDAVWTIAEDAEGRMYFGTGRGLDRFDPMTGTFRHFGTADGLPAARISACVIDSRGVVWIGTPLGLARLDPLEGRPSTRPPPVLLTEVTAGGQPVQIESEDEADGRTVLRHTESTVRIGFVGISFADERRLRYRYRLEGLERAWSAPTTSREVTYARLPSGSYRFMVEAIDLQGRASAQPAAFSFRIVPPIWQRWWFHAAWMGIVAAALLVLHQYRLRHALAALRMRQQVAADLHDDLGSGLAEIAIVSELSSRNAAPDAGERLRSIADRARQLRESMTDIVWAIDPSRDRTSDLVDRMRHATLSTLERAGIEVSFTAPDDAALAAGTLAPDTRRHVWRMFKEVLANICRHAGATRVAVEVDVQGDVLQVTVRDDGRGFDPMEPAAGSGMANLRRRAGAVSARVTAESAPSRGTTIAIAVPLTGTGRRSRLPAERHAR